MRKIFQRMAQSEEFKPLPFWSWNDRLDESELERQVNWLCENGAGGFFMHARSGLETEYLSAEWMKCINECCEKANELGMKAWIYDENGWPSGFAGGKLLENVEYRDQYILHSIGPADRNADVSYRLDKETLVRVDDFQNVEGECLNLYIRRSVSTVDVLNPEVVEQFIENTHCKYKEQFGQEFTTKIEGFFTDEPQYYRWDTPYTVMMAQYFMKEYGEDILNQLGLLFVEKEGYRTFRYRYWCGMQKLMLNNFARKIYNWCEENGVKLTGHYIEESTMVNQLMCCGGVMPFYEYEHIPGIDWLYSITGNEIPPRQVSSVARQMGKEAVMTESFAACGWDATPTEFRRIAGFQFANGVNMICHHLVPYSERGQRKRDYPAHFAEINPWVKDYFRDFNDYFSRLGYLLAKGEEPVNVAILHPIRSVYLEYKRDESKMRPIVRELEDSLSETCRMLSSRGIAYHFLDETLMERHGFVEGNKVGCGKCEYDYLILPKMLTMGVHTEKLIRQYVKNGGNVLLVGDKPEYLEGDSYEYEYLNTNCSIEELEKSQAFTVLDYDTDLFYAYRIFEGKPLLFVQNNSRTACYTQTFQFKNGAQSFVALNPISGEMRKLPLTVTLQEEEALLIFPAEGEVQEEQIATEVEFKFVDAEVEFDENYMTVDTVYFSKNGQEYIGPVLTNELFAQLLEERYCGKLWLRYPFEIEVLPERITLISETVKFEECNVNGNSLAFLDRWEGQKAFRTADITGCVQQGINFYELVVDWHQSEETYYALFGDGVTESLKNSITYDCEIEAIYLSGRFGVYSHTAFDIQDEQTVCGDSFYIGAIPQRVTEPVMDGFPFFRGKLTMKQNIENMAEHTVLKFPGRYLAAKVYINEQECGELLYERRINVSKCVTEGTNEIKAEFIIGNRNLFGPFHMEGPEGFIGPGTFDTLTLSKGENGEYRYKMYRFYPRTSD